LFLELVVGGVHFSEFAHGPLVRLHAGHDAWVGGQLEEQGLGRERVRRYRGLEMHHLVDVWNIKTRRKKKRKSVKQEDNEG